MPPNRSLLSLGLSKEALSALTTSGYETVGDLANATVDGLVEELGLSIDVIERIMSLSRTAPTPASTLRLTQTAAALAKPSEKMSTGCPGLDKILSGGLQRGHFLEISGPPGTPKELIAMNVVSSFIRCGDKVIVIDCQNMIRATTLLDTMKSSIDCPPNVEHLVHYKQLHALPDLLLFIDQLPRILDSIPTASLLLLSSMSFPFQSANLSPANKTAILERVKQTLTRESANRNLTVVLTSQLATKMVNADGSPGTFGTGARGIMVPQLGSTYLPAGRTYRVILSPEGRESGVVKLLSSPTHQSASASSPISEPYSLECS